MNRDTLARLLCGSCGETIARVVDTPGGDLGYVTPYLGGSTATTLLGVWCPSHGRPQVTTEQIATAAETARETGRVQVIRARTR